MKRRAILGAVGVAVGGTLAGCAGQSTDTAAPGEEIVRFAVTNDDEVSRSIEIEIQQDGEVVASGLGTVLPANEQEEPFRYGFPGIGTAVTAVITSDNGGRSIEWDPAECSALQVDVTIAEGEPQVAESCQ